MLHCSLVYRTDKGNHKLYLYFHYSNTGADTLIVLYYNCGHAARHSKSGHETRVVDPASCNTIVFMKLMSEKNSHSKLATNKQVKHNYYGWMQPPDCTQFCTQS